MSNPHVSQICVHDVTAEDVSVKVSIHDTFAAVKIILGDMEVTCFTELDQVAGIQRNLGLL
tara:strand:- start:1158 stop:1340 length:183 start_codon:yes stop_codon:yes gene_type:complete